MMQYMHTFMCDFIYRYHMCYIHSLLVTCADMHPQPLSHVLMYRVYSTPCLQELQLDLRQAREHEAVYLAREQALEQALRDAELRHELGLEEQYQELQVEMVTYESGL